MPLIVRVDVAVAIMNHGEEQKDEKICADKINHAESRLAQDGEQNHGADYKLHKIEEKGCSDIREADVDKLVVKMCPVRAEQRALLPNAPDDCGRDIDDGNGREKKANDKFAGFKFNVIGRKKREHGDEISEALASAVTEKEFCLRLVPEEKSENGKREAEHKETPENIAAKDVNQTDCAERDERESSAKQVKPVNQIVCIHKNKNPNE